MDKKTPKTLVYGELGRYPSYIDSNIRSVNYWQKLQNMPLNQIPKHAYQGNPNNIAFLKNWAQEIKNCFDSFGFSRVWLHGGLANKSSFFQAFTQRMVNCFIQEWSEKTITDSLCLDPINLSST